MRVLAIETSERVATLATLETSDDAAAIVQAVTLPSDQRSARSLLPTLKTLLGSCGWQANQLDLIAVTTGPGSFTGLRIGVTAAKTLAYATETPLVGVHTLAAIAAGVSISGERLWTLLDAQRQELFVAKFEANWQSEPNRLPETRILHSDAWLHEVRAGDVVSGPPLKKLAADLPAGVRVAGAEGWAPRAEQVGLLGIAVYQSGNVVDAVQLVPNYYRKSAAEEKIDNHQ